MQHRSKSFLVVPGTGRWIDGWVDTHGNHYRLICAIHYNTGKVFPAPLPLAR
jgi:hypothetical protein